MGGASGPEDGASEAEGPRTWDEWRDLRLDELALSTLETASLAGAILYLAFTAAHPLFFEGPHLSAVLLLGASSTVAFAALWLATRGDHVPAEWSQTWIGIGMGVVLANTVALATIRQSPETTFWFAIIALACGLLFFSWLLFSTIIALDLAGWAWIATNAAPSPAWLDWPPFVLVAGISLAALTLFSRRRIYDNLLDREYRLRRINRELDQARKQAESAERMQAQFLASVSHDVRTPVTAIIGEAQLLQDPDVDASVRKSVEAIESNARHLLRLIDDLLDISRMEAGVLSVEEQPVRVEALLHDCVEMVRSRAEGKDLELATHVDPDVPAVVETDPHRLQQVLGNLLTNAVKFTDEGTVRLTVEVLQQDPLVLVFEVEDTGPGIPEDRQDELFKPFSRLGRSTTDPEEGTGLGLAISKRIVGLLGGEISVDSTPGQGSTFRFTLPTEPAESTAGPDPATATMASEHPLDILVVDDSPVVRGVVERMLGRLGYEPQLAERGDEALEILLEDRYDVAFLDLELPGLGGAEVARRLKAEQGSEDTRLVALTGHTDEATLEQAREAGIDACLTKPLDIEELVEQLEATEPGSRQGA